ncbi:MAG: hypothetical protein AAGC55_00510, partial [Myxococcota bacterium]
LYIANWEQKGGPQMADMLMAHEIDHALQDQHFNLKKFMKPNKKNGDQTVARHALLEGDGTAVMLEYMLGEMGMGSPWSNPQVIGMMRSQMSSAMTGEIAKAPLVLREGVTFPYLGGVEFVAHFRKQHPWSRIDAIYRKPPLSTEHILHPEKYEAYERPDEIRVRPLPALKGYQMIHENVSGEFAMSLFLRRHVGGQSGGSKAVVKKAEQAVAGWGGDRLALYVPAGHNGELAGAIAVSYTVWDGQADAIEYFEMLSDSLGSLSGGKGTSSAERAEYQNSSGEVFVAQRKGDAVVLVAGAPKSKAAAILDQTWQRWQVRRR